MRLLRLISQNKSTNGDAQMAENGAKIDLPAHERTYSHFIGLFKWGAVGCFLIAMLVIYLITR